MLLGNVKTNRVEVFIVNIKQMIDIEKELTQRVVRKSVSIRDTINKGATKIIERKPDRSKQETERLSSIVIENESLAS